MNHWLFWATFSLLVYTNGGYLLVLWFWAKTSSKEFRGSAAPFTPKVTVLITAFNEEECIRDSIQSILDSDYPSKVVIVSDCSSDRTDVIVSEFSSDVVRLVRMPIRGGKFSAQQMGLTFVSDPILVIADASGVFLPDTIGKLVRHFQNPSVGLVVGRKRIKSTGTVVAEGEGLYWKYDAMLRTLESQTGSSCVGAEGGLTAIRRHLFPTEIPSDIAEDYAMGCELQKRGFQSRYDPTAMIYEIPSDGIKAEFKRKVRVIVKGMRTFFHYRALLNPFQGLSYPFQTVSHKLLRWLGPFILIGFFLCSAWGNKPVERIAFYAQVLFYAAALLGYLSPSFRIKATAIPLYFSTVNLAALAAWGMIFKKYGIWEPTRREQAKWMDPADRLAKEQA